MAERPKATQARIDSMRLREHFRTELELARDRAKDARPDLDPNTDMRVVTQRDLLGAADRLVEALAPHPSDERALNGRHWALFVTDEEKALILALRADPDQQRHIVQYDAEGWGVTVRHPISERVLADDLFACPVLAFAEEHLGGHPTGRYRLSTEGDAFEEVH